MNALAATPLETTHPVTVDLRSMLEAKQRELAEATEQLHAAQAEVDTHDAAVARLTREVAVYERFVTDIEALDEPDELTQQPSRNGKGGHVATMPQAAPGARSGRQPREPQEKRTAQRPLASLLERARTGPAKDPETKGKVIDLVVAALTAAGEPMHIAALAKAVKYDERKLSAQLSYYARNEKHVSVGAARGTWELIGAARTPAPEPTTAPGRPSQTNAARAERAANGERILDRAIAFLRTHGEAASDVAIGRAITAAPTTVDSTLGAAAKAKGALVQRAKPHWYRLVGSVPAAPPTAAVDVLAPKSAPLEGKGLEVNGHRLHPKRILKSGREITVEECDRCLEQKPDRAAFRQFDCVR